MKFVIFFCYIQSSYIHRIKWNEKLHKGKEKHSNYNTKGWFLLKTRSRNDMIAREVLVTQTTIADDLRSHTQNRRTAYILSILQIWTRMVSSSTYNNITICKNNKTKYKRKCNSHPLLILKWTISKLVTVSWE